MFRFQKNYFLLAFILLCVEILIALFIHDSFIRPYVGDFLVVILIYCFVKSFLRIPVITAAIFVLLFAYTVEIAQYFNLATQAGLQNNRVAKIILGNSFEWKDMLAYTCGILFTLFVESKRRRQ